MISVGPAFALALTQLFDPRILRILARSLAVTLALFALLGWAGWHLFDWAFAKAGLADASFWGAESLRGAASLALTLIGGWLLWRIVAMGVIEAYAGEVVSAVEQRHYPEAAVRARELSWREDISASLKAAGRALVANLVTLPFALALLVTGVGTAMLFWLVNAVLIGRELQDSVWQRHAHAAGDTPPLARSERFLLGGAVALLLLLPFANFLAPVLGAAAATHLVHRKPEAAVG